MPPPQTKLHQICIISQAEGIYLFPIKQRCFLKFIPSPESGRRLCYVNGFMLAFYRMNLTLVFEVYVTCSISPLVKAQPWVNSLGLWPNFFLGKVLPGLAL